MEKFGQKGALHKFKSKVVVVQQKIFEQKVQTATKVSYIKEIEETIATEVNSSSQNYWHSNRNHS